MFDKLLILNKGKVNYFGYAKDSINYYSKLGYEVEENKNPIDKFIEIAIKADDDTKL